MLIAGDDDYPGVQQLRELLKQNEVPFFDKTLLGMKHDWRGDWLEAMVSLLMQTDPSVVHP